jgi:hypothetical protein
MPNDISVGLYLALVCSVVRAEAQYFPSSQSAHEYEFSAPGNHTFSMTLLQNLQAYLHVGSNV